MEKLFSLRISRFKDRLRSRNSARSDVSVFTTEMALGDAAPFAPDARRPPESTGEIAPSTTANASFGWGSELAADPIKEAPGLSAGIRRVLYE